MTAVTEPTHLDKVIDQLLSKLETTAPDSEEYSRTVDQLIKLYSLLPNKEPRVKPEVLIGAATNVFGILAILNYERVHVIATKAIGFVAKVRI